MTITNDIKYVGVNDHHCHCEERSDVAISW